MRHYNGVVGEYYLKRWNYFFNYSKTNGCSDHLGWFRKIQWPKMALILIVMKNSTRSYFKKSFKEHVWEDEILHNVEQKYPDAPAASTVFTDDFWGELQKIFTYYKPFFN